MHDNLARLQELTEELNEKDKKLQEQRHTYKTLVELLPEVVLVHRNNTILFINEYGLEVFGYEYKQEMLGKDITELIHPEDQSKARLLLKNLDYRCDQGDFAEIKLIKKDGSVIQGEVGSSKIVWNEQQAVQTVVRDVTKRKNIENALIRYYHRTGKVKSLPISGHNTYELGDGWTINLIKQEQEKDLYTIRARKDTELPRHHHIQRESITVERGHIIAVVDNEKIELKEGQKLIIPSLSTHKLIAIENSELTVKFTPPLSAHEI